MPYVCCRGCGLRFHAVTAYASVVRCPDCDVALAGAQPGAVTTSAADLVGATALQQALGGHGPTLLVFFVRRTLECDAGIGLWAETIARAHVAGRRLRARTASEAVGWLDAMTYRQLARYRATGRVADDAQRRLGVGAPVPQPVEVVEIERLADLDGLRSRAQSGLATLSPQAREIVRLRVVEGQPAAAVAARTGVGADVVRAQVSRSLRMIAQAPVKREPAVDGRGFEQLPTFRAWLGELELARELRAG